MIYLIVAVTYAIGYVLTVGVADIQSVHHSVRYADERYRSDLAFACIWSLIPISWLLAPFLTGFYEHGWRLGRRKV